MEFNNNLEGKVKKINLKAIKPYGDTLDDGKMQLSFTLPVPKSPEGNEAAKKLLESIGFTNVLITHSDAMGDNFSFYVAYASVDKTIDFTKISVPRATNQTWEKEKIINFIENKIKRKIVVVGACIESDAHTVGIDAILNMKGIAGHKGLESYHWFDVYNMGAQVLCEDLIKKAHEVKADAILVSQIVTQKDIHIKNLTRLVELLNAENIRKDIILIAGGPRITHELAIELGYDAGFGAHTFPEDVATFIVQQVAKKLNIL
ncbi:MAG: cobalamin-dependent protein [Spirochaetes bacterium]|nr:cobalamin-dependent protein [Spirochaetota bacterium]